MHANHEHHHEGHGKHAPGEHVDPVCRMTVREGPAAITTEYEGKTYYFCGHGCKVAFEKDPQKYLKEGPQMHM